jgi:hypothetical protein
MIVDEAALSMHNYQTNHQVLKRAHRLAQKGNSYT